MLSSGNGSEMNVVFSSVLLLLLVKFLGFRACVSLNSFRGLVWFGLLVLVLFTERV